MEQKMATFSLQEIMGCPKFQKLPLSIVFEWCKLKELKSWARAPAQA